MDEVLIHEIGTFDLCELKGLGNKSMDVVSGVGFGNVEVSPNA